MIFTKQGSLQKAFLGVLNKNNRSAKLLKVNVQRHDIRYDTTANLIREKQMWEVPMVSCLLRSDLSCDYGSLLPSGDVDVLTVLLKMHLRIIKSYYCGRASSLSAVLINLLMR